MERKNPKTCVLSSQFSIFWHLRAVFSQTKFPYKKPPPPKFNPSLRSSGKTITSWLSRNHSCGDTGPQYCHQLTSVWCFQLWFFYLFIHLILNLELSWTGTCCSSSNSLQKFSIEGKATLLCHFSVTIWDTTQQPQLGMPWESSLLKRNKLGNSCFQAPGSPQQAGGGTGCKLPVNQTHFQGSKARLVDEACQVQSGSSSYLRAAAKSQQAFQNSLILASWHFLGKCTPEEGRVCECILTSYSYYA